MPQNGTANFNPVSVSADVIVSENGSHTEGVGSQATDVKGGVRPRPDRDEMASGSGRHKLCNIGFNRRRSAYTAGKDRHTA